MRPNRLRLVAVLAVAAASVAACGGNSGSTTESSAGSVVRRPPRQRAAVRRGGATIKQGLKIAILPKAINNPYFDAAFAGAKKACDEIKAECEQIGPTQATGAAQVQFINTVIQKRYDALVISAADANSVVPALKKAQDAGVTVVTYDADVADTSARTRDGEADDPRPDRQVPGRVDRQARSAPAVARSRSCRRPRRRENQNAWIGS